MIEKDIPEKEQISNEKELATPEMYGGDGVLYDYEKHDKTDKSIKSYFKLPVVKTFFNELANSEKPISLLDLGSGIGAESVVIKNSLPKSTVTSLELSTYGAQKGKEYFNTSQVQGNALELPFPNQSFNAIHSKDMFIHIRNKDAFFSEAARVLAENGTLLIVTSGLAYEGIGQVAWDLAEVEKRALQHNLVMEKAAENTPEHDDWYMTNPPRYQMIFRKKSSKGDTMQEPSSELGYDPTNNTLMDEFSTLDQNTDGKTLEGIMKYCLANSNAPVPDSDSSESTSIDTLIKLNFLTRVEGGVVLSDTWLTQLGKKDLIK